MLWGEAGTLQWNDAALGGGLLRMDGYLLERGLFTYGNVPDSDGDGRGDQAERVEAHFYSVVTGFSPEKTWRECAEDAIRRGGHLPIVLPFYHAGQGHADWLFGAMERAFAVHGLGLPAAPIYARDLSLQDWPWVIRPNRGSGPPLQNEKFSAYLLEWEISAGGFFPTHDQDGDLISDLDEIGFGTDPKNSDTDGDGFSDFNELNLGSNPLKSESQPVARSSIHTAVEIEVATVRNFSYQIDASVDLNKWTPIGSPIVGDGQTHYRLFSTREHPYQYWRARKMR